MNRRDVVISGLLWAVPAVGTLVLVIRRGGWIDGAVSIRAALRSVGIVLGGTAAIWMLVRLRSAMPRTGQMSVQGHGHGSTRALIARHEAGHAIAAQALGGRVVRGTMTDDSGLVSAVLPGKVGEQGAVTFLLAGERAAGTSRGTSGDRAAIRTELRGLDTRQRREVMHRARKDAARIVRTRRRQIDQVADRMNRTGRF
ncbi:hypothetical protein Ae406Ps2_6343c [Pseudonocardia sp. Ae406_Ps2]|nr:hypothetical protein Ae406Ps2_6343c [Pseudonocardia sp. Ae406_Ps2]